MSVFFGEPYKDCSILGSILGSPYFGKLPNSVKAETSRKRVRGSEASARAVASVESSASP